MLAFVIVCQRYGLDDGRPKSVAEVARLHGITRLKVRELEGRALVALRRILR